MRDISGGITSSASQKIRTLLLQKHLFRRLMSSLRIKFYLFASLNVLAKSIIYLPSPTLNTKGFPENKSTKLISYFPGLTTLMLSKSRTTGLSSLIPPTKSITSCSICTFSSLVKLAFNFCASSISLFLTKKKNFPPQSQPFNNSLEPSGHNLEHLTHWCIISSFESSSKHQLILQFY